MTKHRRTPDFLQHRHGFACWLPRRDGSGLWLRVTWLWWTRDYFPPKTAAQVCTLVDTMRGRDDAGHKDPTP